jgi:hypothetical protein
MMVLTKKLLEDWYLQERLSMAEIAEKVGCSPNKVSYWMTKFGIERREIGEAIYQKWNPDGDPFEITHSDDKDDLFRLAIGLYIGEGKKRTVEEVSLANTDARVIRVFMRFLREICHVNESRLWAQVNVYDDLNLNGVLEYWQKVTGLPVQQFYKPVIRARREGNYINVSQYGTVTVGVNNSKLCKIVKSWCEEYLSKCE